MDYGNVKNESQRSENKKSKKGKIKVEMKDGKRNNWEKGQRKNGRTMKEWKSNERI